MAYNFVPYEQEQLYLLPPSIQDWVKEESLTRFISDVVEELDGEGDLGEFYARYREDGWGRPPYHPRMMVKVLLYGYCVGVRSSRKIAAALESDIGFRYLSANQQPNFRTISDFRKDNLEAFDGLFVKVLELCRQAGLAKMGRVALDGRKVEGNAAVERNRDREYIERQVEEILEEAERTDEEEDDRYGPDNRGDELPEHLRSDEARGRALKEAMEEIRRRDEAAQAEQQARIEAREQREAEEGRKLRGRKPKPPEEVVDGRSKVNLTDPESRVMKGRKGWVQGYNGQAAVDCESQVIVAKDLVQDENDVGQLEPMLERCEEQAGRLPEELLADAGYWSEDNAGQQDDELELYIATAKDWKLREKLRAQGPPRGRIPNDATPEELMERKLLTKKGREAYAQRKTSVEPVFGQMVMRGLTGFLLRGVKKAEGEWSLWCTTHNLLKLWRAGYGPAPAGMVA